jgi:hypothetical protein
VTIGAYARRERAGKSREEPDEVYVFGAKRESRDCSERKEGTDLREDGFSLRLTISPH